MSRECSRFPLRYVSPPNASSPAIAQPYPPPSEIKAAKEGIFKGERYSRG